MNSSYRGRLTSSLHTPEPSSGKTVSSKNSYGGSDFLVLTAPAGGAGGAGGGAGGASDGDGASGAAGSGPPGIKIKHCGKIWRYQS